MEQEIREQNSDEMPTNASTTPTLLQGDAPVATSDARQPIQSETMIIERTVPSTRGHRSGPRSEAGKKRSSGNAMKFGIFSQVILIKGESRSVYESLLAGLWEEFQPEGTLEEVLVEKLAIILWRHRRLLVAEGAEIRKSSEFLEFDRRREERLEAEKISRNENAKMETIPPLPYGLISEIHNPEILKRCIELMGDFRQRIEASSLKEDPGGRILGAIYGYKDHLRPNLRDVYSNNSRIAKISDRERQKKEYPTAEECKQRVLEEVDAEIARLKQYQNKHDLIESNRRKVEILGHRVPNSPRLESLLRCEASLERSFDRTLTQLERAQRMRKGQPLSPQLDVKIS